MPIWRDMRLARHGHLAVLLLLGPLAVLAVLRAFPELDLRWFSAEWHLIAVSVIAFSALSAAAVAIATVARSGQASVIWLALGCVAVGLCMLGHGLTTPGVFGRPSNEWVGRLPHLAMWLFALCLAAASRPPTSRLNRGLQRNGVRAIVTATAVATALVSYVTLRPRSLGGAQAAAWEENFIDAGSTVAVVLLLLVVRTHWRRWRLGYDVVQFAVVLAAAAAIAALVSFEHGVFGQLSWWDYHGYMIAGFGGAVFAVFRRRSDARTLGEILQGAFADDPFGHIVSGYPQALRSLVRAVEMKDAYTHGHSERTARLAVELGLSMGLPPDRLRVIARGAYLHDVGKIAIPDEILNKPGQLTTEEWTVIKAHPELGYEMASGAPSLTEALPVILHHHERIDGGGYPAGLAGAEIPLEARVVAVADVWDALTSDRAYRPGWSPAQALAHIQAGAGTHFDPAAVDALTRLVVGWGVARQETSGVAAVAWEAAETCHEVDADPMVPA